MSTLLKFVMINSLVFSVWAQDLQFQLRGSFPITDNQLPTPSIVHFELEWNEIDGVIRGEYQDSRLQLSSIRFAGESTGQGRTMRVQLPATVKNVRALTFQTAQTGMQSGETATRVVLRDELGNVIASKEVTGTMVARSDEATVATPNVCTIGFGVLSGYCGLYAGQVTETADTLNRCDLQDPSTELRLELALDTSVRLYPRFLNSTPGADFHELGTLPTSPLETDLNLSSRNCGELPATRMNPESCRQLTLSGNFSTTAGIRNFSGTYAIVDEITGETCRYNLNLERVLAY
jgi:hypothetical protein